MLIKTNLFRNIAIALATFATIFAAVPALALAHGTEAELSTKANFGLNNSDKDRKEDKNNHDSDRDDKGMKRGIIFKNLLGDTVLRGVITAKSSTGFSVMGKMNTTITVNTTSAAIIKLPAQTITLADLTVGDYVAVQGTRTNNNIVATKVFMIPPYVHPAVVKGNVTAVSGNTVTIQTKKGNTVTVNTNADTKITNKDGSTAVLSNIVIGSKLRIAGIWDSMLNILTALRIKIK